MTEQLTAMAKTVSDEMINKISENPDKLYFPFFGKGDNILKSGIKIDRVMFTIPGTDIEIYWYGFLIGLGILLAMIYGFKKMKSLGVDPDRAIDAVIGGIIGALVGGRLYYVIFSIDNYLKADGGLDFKAIINVRDGGMAIYGGLIGGILVGGIIAKIKKIRLPALLDVVGPCFLIGQAVGRWGNFFNIEAFGSNTTLPWGMMSRSTMVYLSQNYDTIAASSGIVVDNYLPVHPCFLYESLWCVLGFVLLHLYSKHRKFDGEVFLMYIGWYGLGRFFIEMLRTDSLYFGKIKVSELVAGTCVLAAIVLIIVFRSIVKRSGEYKFFYETDVSKAQLAQYDAYNETKKKKDQLKKKIKEARSSGESTTILEKELAQLKNSVIVDTADNTESDKKYTSILDEDEIDEDEIDNDESEEDTDEVIEKESVLDDDESIDENDTGDDEEDV